MYRGGMHGITASHPGFYQLVPMVNVSLLIRRASRLLMENSIVPGGGAQITRNDSLDIISENVSSERWHERENIRATNKSFLISLARYSRNVICLSCRIFARHCLSIL